MKVRLRTKPDQVGTSDTFDVNTCAPQEVFVNYADERVAEFTRDLDVFIEAKKEWIPFGEARKNHDIIADNYNTCFFEPKTPEDRERGHTND